MQELCRVLIVDDEYIMRQGVKHLINWDKEGFLIVGEAANGEEALLLVEQERPHIVVLDVVMPIIDGVELTKIIHEKYPEIKIIVLSGFDKFEYVKETLINGADDYILKPTLSPSVFLESLKKVADNIPDLNYSGERNINLNHSLEWFMTGYVEEFDAEEFPAFTQKDSYRIFGININYAYGNNEDNIKALRKKIRKVLSDNDMIFARLEIENKNLIYIINYDSNYELNFVHLIMNLAEEVKQENRKAFFVLSEAFNNIQQIKDVYYTRFESKLETGFYNEFKSLLNIQNNYKEEVPLPKFDFNEFSYFLRNGEYDKALDELKKHTAGAIDKQADYEQIKNQVKNLVYNVIISIEEYGIDVDNMRKQYFSLLDEKIFADEFMMAVDDIINDIKENLENKVPDNDKKMLQITRYIVEHYRENLDLDTLAKEFNYNYNYLSSYFNSQNKEGFSGYLNKIRIEKSCDLLKKDDISIADISYQVGYSDHSYFCRVFKKTTGYTPSVYRKRFRGGTHETKHKVKI